MERRRGESYVCYLFLLIKGMEGYAASSPLTRVCLAGCMQFILHGYRVIQTVVGIGRELGVEGVRNLESCCLGHKVSKESKTIERLYFSNRLASSLPIAQFSIALAWDYRGAVDLYYRSL